MAGNAGEGPATPKAREATRPKEPRSGGTERGRRTLYVGALRGSAPQKG